MSKEKKKRMSRLELLKDKLEFLISHKASEKEISEVQGQIDRSKRSKRSHAKGNTYENVVGNIINTAFNNTYNIPIDMKRVPKSGGWSKSSNNDQIKNDLCNLNKDYDFTLGIECKDRATWALPSWIKQAESECPKFRIPIVAFHQQKKIKDGKVVQVSKNYVCLQLEDFLQLIDPNKVVRKAKLKPKIKRRK